MPMPLHFREDQDPTNRRRDAQQIIYFFIYCRYGKYAWFVMYYTNNNIIMTLLTFDDAFG